VQRDAVALEDLQHAGVGDPAREPAAERQPDARRPSRLVPRGRSWRRCSRARRGARRLSIIVTAANRTWFASRRRNSRQLQEQSTGHRQPAGFEPSAVVD
jgi:hypothetical protein